MTKNYVSLKNLLEELGCTASLCTSKDELLKVIKEEQMNDQKIIIFFLSLKNAKLFTGLCEEIQHLFHKPYQLVIITSIFIRIINS